MDLGLGEFTPVTNGGCVKCSIWEKIVARGDKVAIGEYERVTGEEELGAQDVKRIC